MHAQARKIPVETTLIAAQSKEKLCRRKMRLFFSLYYSGVEEKDQMECEFVI